MSNDIVHYINVGNKKYGLRKLTNKETQDVEIKSKAAYATALREGCSTDIEMEKFIKERNLMDSEEITTKTLILSELSREEEKLKDESISKDKKIDIAKNIAQKRKQFVDLTTKYHSLFDKTADSISRDNKVKNMFVLSVIDLATGKQVFNSVKDFDNMLDNDNIAELYKEYLYYIYDIDKEFHKSLPENQWLSENNLSEFTEASGVLTNQG